MQTKLFHLGDVLSITTQRLVSSRHITGVYDILNFMTGDNLSTPGLIRATAECKPYLINQFPQLITPEMDSAIVGLDNMLGATDQREQKMTIVTDWLARQVAKYGEMFAVNTIPAGAHKAEDMVTEFMDVRNGR